LKDLRDDLDDLRAYRAEDADAPLFLLTKERIDRLSRENTSRGRRLRPNLTLAPIAIGDEEEDEDEDEASGIEDKPILQSGDTGDEAAASGEVGEMEVDEVDEAVEESKVVEADEAVEGVEAVISLDEAAAVHERCLDGFRLDFDRRLEDAILQIREAALADRKALQKDFDDKAQQAKDAAESHTTHMVEKVAKEIGKAALRAQQTANTEHYRRMLEAEDSHKSQMAESAQRHFRQMIEAAEGHELRMAYRLRVRQRAQSKLEALEVENATQRVRVVAVEAQRRIAYEAQRKSLEEELMKYV
jgi:hypothetical protein